MGARRFPRTLIRRLELPDLPLDTLAAVRELRRYIEQLEGETLLRARELGASPADMGRALGISRQAVYNKLRALQERASEEPVVIPELEEHPTD